MKICLISKYPPIEGGVSSQTYWLAKALGERGHEVHIVTNAQEVEEEYREDIDIENEAGQYQPPNVYIHNIDPSPLANPSHIPFSKAYCEKLANLSIEVIKKHNLQLIDSWYLLPYAVSGFLAKTITGKPQIIRHAGSDINRLFDSPYLRVLFKSIFERVDTIVTYPDSKEVFLNLGIPESKLFLNQKIAVDTTAFNPEVEPIDLSKYTDKDTKNLPVITYIGKITYHSETKGIYELLEVCQGIKDDFLLLFVGNGKELKRLQEEVRRKGLESRTIFLNFVPPWKVPSIIKRSTCVVLPERDFPIPNHMPSIPREVMATGKCLLLSRELYQKEAYKALIDGENILIIDPKNIKQFRSTLEKIIKNPDIAERIGQKARRLSGLTEDFDKYVSHNILMYEKNLSIPLFLTINHPSSAHILRQASQI